MKPKSSLLECVLVVAALFALPIEKAAAATTASDQSGGPGWPREHYQNGNRLIVYQPQVDDWKNFQDLSWRMAVSLTQVGKTASGNVYAGPAVPGFSTCGFDRSGGGGGFGGDRFGGGGGSGRFGGFGGGGFGGRRR